MNDLLDQSLNESIRKDNDRGMQKIREGNAATAMWLVTRAYRDFWELVRTRDALEIGDRFLRMLDSMDAPLELDDERFPPPPRLSDEEIARQDDIRQRLRDLR